MNSLLVRIATAAINNEMIRRKHEYGNRFSNLSLVSYYHVPFARISNPAFQNRKL